MIHEISIRNAIISDANEISNMVIDNARVCLRKHYSEEQWSVFLSYYSVEVVVQKIQSQALFCAVFQGVIVGIIALDYDYVVGFYTNINYVNKGIGGKMLQFIENFAKKKGFNTIQLASSPVGFEFYCKHGWQKVEELQVVYYEVGFVETIMIKHLE
jgi:GNAT superfamily N-acetyltransferase